MLTDRYPLLGLRLGTPRLELRTVPVTVEGMEARLPDLGLLETVGGAS